MSENNGNGLQQHATSAVEWKKSRKEGVLLELPSGNTAMLRPVDFTMVMRLGKLPDTLTPIVIELFNGNEYEINDVEAFNNFWEIVNAIIPIAFVSPKVVEKPTKEDEIGLDDVSDVDKAYVFTLLGHSARDLHSFRQEQEKRLEHLHAGEDVESEAESDVEIEGMGASELSAG